MGPWPTSLLDWDILFLLPLPWWGPVLAPVLIALLLIAGGLLIVSLESRGRIVRIDWGSILVAVIGTMLALYVFMADALVALPRGMEAIQEVLPQSFNWPLFILSLVLMAVPGIGLAGSLSD
jgi:hypothetical protein